MSVFRILCELGCNAIMTKAIAYAGAGTILQTCDAVEEYSINRGRSIAHFSSLAGGLFVGAFLVGYFCSGPFTNYLIQNDCDEGFADVIGYFLVPALSGLLCSNISGGLFKLCQRYIDNYEIQFNGCFFYKQNALMTKENFSNYKNQYYYLP